MSNKVEVTGGNMGFCSILTLIFIVLKLTHYIDWSWLWVLSPLWIPIAIILVILVIGCIAAVLSGFTK